MAADLPERIRAVVKKRKALAEEASKAGKHWYVAYYSTMEEWRVRDKATQAPIADVIGGYEAADREACEFIAANDPADVLRECAYALGVLERHSPYPPHPPRRSTR